MAGDGARGFQPDGCPERPGTPRDPTTLQDGLSSRHPRERDQPAGSAGAPRRQGRGRLWGDRPAGLDHLGDHLVRGAVHAVRQVVGGHRAHVRVGHDLDDIAGRYGDEAVHLQDRQEGLVELVRRHRRGRDEVHLRAHARVDDEVAAGRGAHRLGHLHLKDNPYWTASLSDAKVLAQERFVFLLAWKQVVT